MARYVLLRTINNVSGHRLRAGQILNDAFELDTINLAKRIAPQAVVRLPSAALELGADEAQSRAAIGADPEELDTIMALAFIQAVSSGRVEDNPYLEQLEWWVSVEDGDDSNDGATEATALKTFAEFRRRFGSLPRIEKHYVVNVKAGTYPETLELSGRFYGNDAVVEVIGHPRVVASGTVNSFEYPDFFTGANGRPGRLTDVGVADWSAILGYRLHFDPDGSNESYTFGLHHPTEATTVSCTVGAAVKDRVPPGTTFGSVAVFPGGTQYLVEDLPVFEGCEIEVTRPYYGTGGSDKADSFVIKHLAFRNLVGTCIILSNWRGSGSFWNGSAPIFFACSINANVYGNASFVGCGWTYHGDGEYGRSLQFQGGEVYIAGGIGGGANIWNNCFIHQISGPQGPGAFQFNNPLSFYNGVKWAGSANALFGVYCDSNTGAVRVDQSCEVNFYSVFGENRKTSGPRNVAFCIAGRALYYNLPKLKAGAGAPHDILWCFNQELVVGAGVDYGSLPAETSIGVEGFNASFTKLPL